MSSTSALAAVLSNKKNVLLWLQVVECFGTGENANGSSGGGAKVGDVLKGLGLGSLTMDEKRSRAVTDAFRELDEDGSGVLRAGKLRRRYDAAPAASSSCDAG